MARYSTHFDYYQQPSTLDVPPEEDEMSVLDDKILDTTSPGLSDPRRASYDTQDALSHRNSVWSNYSNTSSESRQTSHLSHSVIDSGNPSFMPMDSNQSYQQPVAGWNLSRQGSGSCTPTAYDQYQSEESATGAPFSGGAVGPVNSIPMGAVSYRGGMGFAQSGGVAMSPQSSQGWMPAPMDLADAAAAQAKSAAYRNGSPLTMRRDGIRKKNARFEIPAERTLSNIDQLINQSNNDEEIKELKQQKRLLRNRQAALDSRQRKKLHTEKLEEEKKTYTNVINQLQDEVNKLREREAELIHERTDLIGQRQHMTNYLGNLHHEKDEMIRVHTLETAELRKKNNILMETVEKLERGVKPVDNTAEFAGFESLSMENHPWEDFNMANGMPMQEPASAQPQPQQPALQVAERSDKSALPFSWNAFYMCLLVGAFIASNSNSSLPGRSLPQLSEEYRAESANVLKAVLSSSQNEFSAAQTQTQVPTAVPTGSSAIPTMEMVPMAQPGSSTLDELHDTLVMPTEEQQRAQVFALNPEQYNTLTTFDDEAFKPQQPSNLQQALAAMRNNAAQHRMGATSDVYSRSLMWDRVPEKVIRDFNRMVHEFGAPVKEEMMGFASG